MRTFGSVRGAFGGRRRALEHAVLRAVDRDDGRNAAHQIEAAVRGRLAMKVDDVEALRAARRDAAAREQPGVQLVAEAREVEVASPNAPSFHNRWQSDAADGAIEQRQILRQHDMRAVNLRLAAADVGEKTMERRETEDAAVDEQHARHQSETASSPGTIGRVRGSSPRRAMLPT